MPEQPLSQGLVFPRRSGVELVRLNGGPPNQPYNADTLLESLGRQRRIEELDSAVPSEGRSKAIIVGGILARGFAIMAFPSSERSGPTMKPSSSLADWVGDWNLARPASLPRVTSTAHYRVPFQTPLLTIKKK
jgi:hypothetical protein